MKKSKKIIFKSILFLFLLLFSGTTVYAVEQRDEDEYLAPDVSIQTASGAHSFSANEILNRLVHVNAPSTYEYSIVGDTSGAHFMCVSPSAATPRSGTVYAAYDTGFLTSTQYSYLNNLLEPYKTACGGNNCTRSQIITGILDYSFGSGDYMLGHAILGYIYSGDSSLLSQIYSADDSATTSVHEGRAALESFISSSRSYVSSRARDARYYVLQPNSGQTVITTRKPGKGRIKIVKTTSSGPVDGFWFEIYEGTSCSGTLKATVKTGADGTAYWPSTESLNPNNQYCIKEVTDENGFAKRESQITTLKPYPSQKVIKVGAGVKTVSVKNSDTPEDDDDDEDTPGPGPTPGGGDWYCAVFGKYDASTGSLVSNYSNLVLSFNGQNYSGSNFYRVFLGDSQPGNVSVSEVSAPVGYYRNGTPVNAQIIPITIPYTYEEGKTEAETAQNIANAKAATRGQAEAQCNSYSPNISSSISNYKVLLNFYKVTENGSTNASGAEFIVRNASNQYIKVTGGKVETKDAGGNTKYCYDYDSLTSNRAEASRLVSDENGEVCIQRLPGAESSTEPYIDYYVTEVESAENHTLENKNDILIRSNNVFVERNESNTFVNYPTDFKFSKDIIETNIITQNENDKKYTITINGNTVTKSFYELSTDELHKITFSIYDSNGNQVEVIDMGNGYYEYAHITHDTITGNVTKELHLGVTGELTRQLRVKHLPKGKYSIKEVDTSSCQIDNGGFNNSTEIINRPENAAACGGSNGVAGATCLGYYQPNYLNRTGYEFTINKCSSEEAKNNSECTADGDRDGSEVQSLTNVPTEIILTKKDFYHEESPNDNTDVIETDRIQDSKESDAEFANDKERNDFDRIDFKIYRLNANGEKEYLNFIYVSRTSMNTEMCKNDETDFAMYRYIPGLNLPDGVNPDVFNYHELSDDSGITVTQTLHSWCGYIKIMNLCRGEKYFIEEVKVPDDSVYVREDTDSTPVQKCFEIPCTNTEDVTAKSETKIIYDKPTRVTFEKRDSKYNYIIPDPVTTFEVYRCPKDENGENTKCHPTYYNTVEERENAGMKLIKFNPRAVISGDEEDSVDTEELPNAEVYRMMSESDSKKLNKCSNELGDKNCYVTSLHPYKGELTLRYLQSNYNYVLLETVAPVNYLLPTELKAETPFTVNNQSVTKVDDLNIPNQPTGILIRKYSDDGKLLGGAKFKLYKVTNYDANRKPQKQEKELLKFKTIKAGIYEHRPVLDSDIIETCTGAECSNTSELTYGDKDYWSNLNYVFDNVLSSTGNQISTLLKEGTALVQYLEYNNYYVVEEVEAPKGYSLPEDDDDRFTLVHIGYNETVIQDTEHKFVNKPTPFTFYKYDEYNKPLDGAKFVLQKLNDQKKYKTIKVNKEEPGLYKADYEGGTNEIIQTVNGSATVYYLEEGQYRILEVAPAEGYELPKKAINVVTFFVDKDGRVYGEHIIANKKPTEIKYIKPNAKANLIINIQTGRSLIKYGLIIAVLIAAISGLMIFMKKRK